MSEVAWNESSDLCYMPTGRDCSWAAWVMSFYGIVKNSLFWDTVRDLMLAGF